MPSYEVIGKAIPRVDGPLKVTGQAVYAADVTLPGMLWGKALLSPHAHARITRIDATAARNLPGVHAVLTGADVPGHLFGRALKDVPILSRDRVRHAGERVAAVAADDEDIAQQALDLIEVEYEELPAVFDVVEAAAEEAPLLHPDYNSYTGIRRPLDTPSNAYHRTHFEKGDVTKGFAEADAVIENTYRTQMQHAGYLEPQAVIVWNDTASGRVNVWACNKVPYRLKGPIAHAFAVPEEEVLIHPTYIGGDFGAKSAPTSLAIAYYLAKATDRPVKMVHEYLEELLAGNPNQSMVFRLKTGVKRDGTITAHQVQHYANCGAYGGYKPGGVMGGATQAAGPYKVENVRLESMNVYTNTLPGQILRAPGETQAIFAIESHIDEVARAIEMDPVAFRMRNLIETGEEMAAGEVLEDVRVKETLQAAVDAGGYGSDKAPFIGRGVAVADRSQGGGPATASITLKPDGSVVVGTPLFDQGTGAYTTLVQVTAEELQVPLDQIAIEVWNTDSVQFDSGIAGSVQSRVSSTIAFQAAEETKKALIGFVARQLGWPEAHLSVRGHEIWRTDIEERVDWHDLLRETGTTITGRAQITEMPRPHFTSFAAQVAEVSVDPETGEVKLLKLTTAHDVGQILNAIGHQGQINGGVVQGIGFAMMEELRFEDGRVTNVSMGDYKIPTIRDIPELTTVLVQTEKGSGPYSVKGIGELPMVPVAAAIANAVRDAIGVRIRDLPITAEKVYRERLAAGG
ncbi:MAG: xanthine dehydrogenase family protein molybdopterin-binding subunit [Dehalococcoidia bacterium]